MIFLTAPLMPEINMMLELLHSAFTVIVVIGLTFFDNDPVFDTGETRANWSRGWGKLFLKYTRMCIKFIRERTEFLSKGFWRIVSSRARLKMQIRQNAKSRSNKCSYSARFYRPHARKRTSDIGNKYLLYGIKHLALIHACQSLAHGSHPVPDHSFDSDSYELVIDTGASKSITNNKKDFIHPPTKVRGQVKGIGGLTSASYAGIVRWRIEDDIGVTHTIQVPAVYVPSSPYRILSPQQWARYREDEDGTGATALGNHLTLFWNKKKDKRKVHLDARVELFILRTTPGYNKFAHFAEQCQCDEGIHCFFAKGEEPPDPELIPTQDQTRDDERYPAMSGPFRLAPPSHKDHEDHQDPRQEISFHDEMVEEKEDELKGLMTEEKELLYWHYRFSHMPFGVLKRLANVGILPKRLVNARSPACAGCLYGRATKRAKVTKNPKGKAQGRAPVKAPGDCVSVDHMHSSTPGFIGQVKGRLTTQRYKVATVFVDNFSGASFVYLQRSTSRQETLEAKMAFEQWARSQGPMESQSSITMLTTVDLRITCS